MFTSYILTYLLQNFKCQHSGDHMVVGRTTLTTCEIGAYHD